MAKRKKTEPELPLFDLPLRPEDPTASVDTAELVDEPTVGEGVEEDLAESPEPSSPVQTMLPDLVIEPPSRQRSEASEAKERAHSGDPATTPRARLASQVDDKEYLAEAADGELDDDVMSLSLVAPVGERALAGLADLGINLLMLALAALASHFVGVEITLDLWPPFVGLSLVLSFLYWIIPLAFWGQTPGMAWLGSIARSFDDEPLSFGQALLRWLGAWITAGLLGLPQLLALWGRSLTDRLSDSKTLVLPDEPDD